MLTPAANALVEAAKPVVAGKPWVLYLLVCRGDRLYAGITNDLPARFKAHCAGKGALFTRGFPPDRILAACVLSSKSHALKAEYALKQLPREKKRAFLAACGSPIDVEKVAASLGLVGAEPIRAAPNPSPPCRPPSSARAAPARRDRGGRDPRP